MAWLEMKPPSSPVSHAAGPRSMAVSRRLSCQMQIPLVEIRKRPKTVRVRESDRSTEAFGKAFCLQFLEHPIDLMRGDGVE